MPQNSGLASKSTYTASADTQAAPSGVLHKLPAQWPGLRSFSNNDLLFPPLRQHTGCQSSATNFGFRRSAAAPQGLQADFCLRPAPPLTSP